LLWSSSLVPVINLYFDLANFSLGGPGVGKGTQCALLAQEFDFHHISVGDLLREEDKSLTSPFRGFISKSIKNSVLLPAQLTTDLLKREMSKAQAAGKHRFLLDGFPRSVKQAADFELKVAIAIYLVQP
jgi:adenylate kinase family enzyme